MLTCYVGMIVILLITHIGYIENRYPGSACWIVIMIAMLSLAIIGSGASVLVHIYGYVFGMVIGLGFYPKHQESSITPNCGYILKILAGLIILGVIALAIIL